MTKAISAVTTHVSMQSYFFLTNYLCLFVSYFVCLFVCLWLIVPLENCSLIWRIHHYRRRMQSLTYARHSWPLSSEDSLTYHTYCDPEHPFIIVISEDLGTHTCCRVLVVELSLPIFTTSVCRGCREHPTFRLRSKCSIPQGVNICVNRK